MNVLIVDDDHLVRKGIVSMMPWDEFGLRVIGEAENGAKALQFMASRPVDLLMTDIAMPTMSGVELLREVKDRHPGVAVVMLTFHQDFEYVQEALRLGAIDYIAKVEMEKDNMHDILGRIIRRMRESAANPAGAPAAFRAAGLTVPEGAERALLLMSLAGEGGELLGELLPPERQHAVAQIERDVWLLPELADGEEREIEARLFDRLGRAGKWALVKVAGIRAHNRKRLYSLLAEYASLRFFYEYRPGRGMYEIDLSEWPAEQRPLSEKELYRLGERWSSLELVYDEELFRGLVRELEDAMPPAAKLESMLFGALVQWEKYVPLELAARFEQAELRCWAEWVRWLDDARQEVRQALLGHHYSEDVMAGVLKAVDYINHNLSLDLRLTEVAESVHISRSYFSECFKNITGKTFNEYIRDARIDYSKALLSQTKDPIYRIAEKCGYPDEKYFSKVFRKKVGVLPSEVRRRGRVE